MAVAEDGHAVAQAEDLLHAVRDVDHAEPAFAQAADNREEHLGLPLGQRGGRFVEDDDARVRRDGPGDRDHLLLGDGEGAHGYRRIERHAQLGEQPGGGGGHGAVVDQAEAANRLAAQEDVLGDRQVGLELELLVHGADAELLRVGGILDVDGRAGQVNRATVGLVDAAEDLDQGGLAGAVLAHQGVHLARAEIEPGPGQRLHAGEGLRDIA